LLPPPKTLTKNGNNSITAHAQRHGLMFNMKGNAKASVKRLPLLQLCPFTPIEAFAKVASTDNGLLSDTKNSLVVPLKISNDLITTFLSRVHPFKALGLEAQGYACSLDQASVIEYLVLTAPD